MNGTANLAGTLTGALVNGYSPTSRQSYDFMTYNNRTGDFGAFALPASFQSLGKPASYGLTFVPSQTPASPGLAENETRRLNDDLLGTLTSLLITREPKRNTAQNVCN